MLSIQANYRNCDLQIMTLTNANQRYPLPAITAASQAKFTKPEKIIIQAPVTNSAPIMVGKAGSVAADYSTGGYEISPGGDLQLPGHMIADWEVVAAAAGQKLFVTYLSGVY